MNPNLYQVIWLSSQDDPKPIVLQRSSRGQGGGQGGGQAEVRLTALGKLEILGDLFQSCQRVITQDDERHTRVGSSDHAEGEEPKPGGGIKAAPSSRAPAGMISISASLHL